MDKGISARLVDDRGRRAVALSNGSLRAVIDAQGGMVPEFGLLRGSGLLNAHYIPDFRGNSGQPYRAEDHAAFWKAKLLYHLAGDFPCSPNFGGACTVDGVEHPIHGWTADREWKLDSSGADAGLGAAYARFSLESPDTSLPLFFEKTELIFAGERAYYSVLTVRNRGAAPVSINMARHNTLGGPFLAAGCRISLAAERFMTAPPGGEFESTGRLALGTEFAELAAAPLRDGKTIDLSLVPGIVGYSDLVTGAIPERLGLGWSCVVNPALKLAYVCFFPGSAGLPAGEVALGFNDLWLQYGGRTFTPWASGEGEPDRSFCLGTENAVGAFAEGLGYSRAHPSLLGRQTLVEVPAHGARTLYYGTALVDLDPAAVGERIRAIESDGKGMLLRGERSSLKAAAGADFSAARSFLKARGWA
jgi:hypothetical protein